MNDLNRVKVLLGSTIRSTIQIIDSGAIQIALIVDQDNKLIGTVTDGDVRRGLLASISLDDVVEKIMNKNPIFSHVSEGRDSILARMKKHDIYHMPVVDKSGVLIGLETIESLLEPKSRDNIVVLMAGGLGARLRPLTEDCPKPMLKVGGKPILETILTSFINQGFTKFYIALNYMPEVITNYFGDGSKWGAKIQYLHEKEKLGTAGALSLLPETPQAPFFVMNGDLLTTVNFTHLLELHQEYKAAATMCVREYDFQVPYGVVNIDEHRILSIDEKPIQKFFVNAGIYAISPEVLTLIPKDTYFDMPSLFDKLIEQKKEAAVFPLREYWMDIGQMSDFDRANGDFMKVFK